MMVRFKELRGSLKSLKFSTVFSVSLCAFSVALCVTNNYKNLHRDHRVSTEFHRGPSRQPLKINYILNKATIL
jgi:hypothetical protein